LNSLENDPIKAAKDFLMDVNKVEKTANSDENMEKENRPIDDAINLVKDDNAFMKSLIEKYLTVKDHNSRATVLYLAVYHANFEDNDLFKKVFNSIQINDGLVSVQEVAMRKITDIPFIEKYANLTDDQVDTKMLPNGDTPKDWSEKYNNSLLREYARNRLKEIKKP